MEVNKPFVGQHIEVEDLLSNVTDSKKHAGADNEHAQEHIEPFSGDGSGAPDKMVPPDELPESDSQEMLQDTPIEEYYPDIGITIVPNEDEIYSPDVPDFEMDPSMELTPELIEPDPEAIIEANLGENTFDPAILAELEQVLQAGMLPPAEMPVIDTNEWTSDLSGMFGGQVDNPNALVHIEPEPMDVVAETDLNFGHDEPAADAFKL